MSVTSSASSRANGHAAGPAMETGAPIVEITGVIKWFNAGKGYGFITPDDGTPDVQLHITCLQRDGYKIAYEGAKVVCEAAESPKGRRCYRVLSMDESTAIIPPPVCQPTTSQLLKNSVKRVYGPERMTVRFFNTTRGFGFFKRPGEQDVFVHIDIVRRCGIDTLVEDQEMMVSYGPNEGDLRRRLVAVNVAPNR